MLDVRRLALLAAVLDSGSMTAAAEQLGLTQQHFASRVHWRLPEKGRELRGSAASLASRSCPAQLTWRSGLPAKNAVAFSAS